MVGQLLLDPTPCGYGGRTVIQDGFQSYEIVGGAMTGRQRGHPRLEASPYLQDLSDLLRRHLCHEDPTIAGELHQAAAGQGAQRLPYRDPGDTQLGRQLLGHQVRAGQQPTPHDPVGDMLTDPVGQGRLVAFGHHGAKACSITPRAISRSGL